MVITQGIVEEDTTSAADSYAIEVGAFENETEADALRDRLSTIPGKEVNIVLEDNLYKVLVTGFAALAEVEEVFPVLQSNGISEIGLITFKGMLTPVKDTKIHSAETIAAETIMALEVVQEILIEDNTSSSDSYTIEVGAFINESEANALKDHLSTILGKEVSLYPVDDLYKVRITGFETMEEVEETFPVLQNKGINKIGLITYKGMLTPAQDTNIEGGETIPDETFSDIVITQEKIKEDTTSISDSYAIEVGAFKTESEALALRDQLSTLLGKEVSLYPENELYKVRITGIETMDEVEETFPVIISEGINNIGLISFKGMLNQALVTNIPIAETGSEDTLSNVVVAHEKIKDDTTSSTDSYVIEVGAFKNESEANALREQLSNILGKEVSLFPEDDLYKVRITGFETTAEIEETYPILISNGINEIGLITYKGLLKPDTVISIPAVIVHNILVEDPTSSTDSYAIQLGAFKRKENAQNLREKLAGILGTDVVITNEDEFYKVRVTGFTSSYEVERYIPTLVQHGIREIWVVTLKGTLKPDIVAGEPDIHREVLNTITEKDTTYLIIHNVFEEFITTGPDSYAIQLGTFNRKINADALRAKLVAILGREVKIFVEDELYKVRILGFDTRNEAKEYLPVLHKIGMHDIKVLKLKGMQNYRTAVSILDTISGAQENLGVKDTSHLTIKETNAEVRKSTLDSTVTISKTIIPEKKNEEVPVIPVEEKVTVVKETPVAISATEEPKEEIVEVPYEVERKKSLEERLLDAEYRSGLYEARWPGVEFTIQIAASRSISDPEDIKKKFGLSGNVKVVKVDEWYRFTTGSYIKYWQAREYRNILRSRIGIEDAFVVAYKEGKRIMLTDLLAMVKSTPDASTGITVRPEISKGFSIQILATKDGSISVTEIRNKYQVDDDIFKEYNESDGLYRYSIGNFSTYTGAVKVRNKIRAKGFRDAFVVGYKEGKRVKDLKSILENGN